VVAVVVVFFFRTAKQGSRDPTLKLAGNLFEPASKTALHQTIMMMMMLHRRSHDAATTIRQGTAA
jgi:hypothetical protein